MAFIEYNPNPDGKRVGDCVVRAVSKALDIPWEQAYTELAFQGYMMRDMPTSNHVWGAYLKSRGFRQEILPDCPDCYTVAEFCEDHPDGVYVLATGSHAVAAVSGNYYDSWDSGREGLVYVWHKMEGE